jgi:uridine monophosphate synthetase
MKSSIQLLADRVQSTGSRLCVGLDFGPQQAGLPGFTFPTLADHIRWLVDQTGEMAACYKFQFAGYLALGAGGMAALRESVAYIKEAYPAIPVILDAKFSDIAVSLDNYACFAFDELGADAVTANPLLGEEACRPLLDRPDKLVYFLCSTSNPGSDEFQMAGGKTPLYLYIAERVAAWRTAGACGLVVGATHPERVAAIRAAAPDLPFLMPGLGAQGGQPEAFLPPALASHPASVVVNVSRGVMQAQSPSEAAQGYVEQINRATSAPTAARSARQAVIDLLAEAGCVQYGDFTLASGAKSSVYIDLRLLSGHPAVLRQIAAHLHRASRHLAVDALVTIPTAGLPIGTALALHGGLPLLYVRREAKAYGAGRQIEGGALAAGQRVLLLDDVISSGGSKVQAVEALRDLGVEVAALLVVVDRRDAPGEDFMGAPIISLLALSDLLEA